MSLLLPVLVDRYHLAIRSRWWTPNIRRSCSKVLWSEQISPQRTVYFKDLWLLALKHHVFWLNRAGSKDRESPYKKVWGKDYEVHPNDHNFGSLCYYKIDKAALINKGDMRGEPAIWVGRDLNTEGHIVVPISWVYNENKFELFQPNTVKAVKV